MLRRATVRTLAHRQTHLAMRAKPFRTTVFPCKTRR